MPLNHAHATLAAPRLSMSWLASTSWPDRLARVRAMAAATDNVGVFFGEDIFLAVASILLIKGFLDSNGIFVTPFQLSVWAIPTAIAAFLVHGFRLLRLDRRAK